MTQTTLKVKNGTITLPKELSKAWKDARVFVSYSQDTLMAKKIREPVAKLSDIAKRISLPPLTSMR